MGEYNFFGKNKYLSVGGFFIADRSPFRAATFKKPCELPINMNPDL
jgi:hypothetical protein